MNLDGKGHERSSRTVFQSATHKQRLPWKLASQTAKHKSCRPLSTSRRSKKWPFLFCFHTNNNRAPGTGLKTCNTPQRFLVDSIESTVKEKYYTSGLARLGSARLGPALRFMSTTLFLYITWLTLPLLYNKTGKGFFFLNRKEQVESQYVRFKVIQMWCRASKTTKISSSLSLSFSLSLCLV